MKNYAGKIPIPGTIAELNSAVEGRKGRPDDIAARTDLTSDMVAVSLTCTGLASQVCSSGSPSLRLIRR